MRHKHYLTIPYFLVWGLFFGTTLGALSGTLIYPVFGTMYSTAWGLGRKQSQE